MSEKLTQWKAVIERATKEKLSIQIEGYESSAKDVISYIVTPGIPNLYKTLVDQSLADLQELDLKVVPKLKAAGVAFTLVELAQAVQELQDSFTNSLEGNNQRTYTQKRVTTDTGKGYWEVQPDSQFSNEELYIKHLLKESSIVERVSEKAPVKSKPVTIIKKHIKELLPISNYIAQLNISELKVRNISIVE